MNDLQVALIAAGAAVVAGVWAYNKWQERAHRKLGENVFREEQPDVLMAGQEADPSAARQEPVGRVEPVEPVERVERVERVEPQIEPQLAAEEPPAPQALPPLPTEWADEVADCIIRIDFIEPVGASALWAAQSPWASHLGKPVSWLGFDEAAGCWQCLTVDHATGRHGVVCAALQLADRRGPVSDAELSVFLDGVRQVAQQFSGVAEVPPRDDMLLHARALDDFCAGVDLQLGVNIVEGDGGAFAGTKLRGLAEATGLELLEDGRFHALDDDRMTVFTLGNLGAEVFAAESLKSLATHGVTLSLDVPRVADGPAGFDRMLGVARQMTQGLGGVLVDGQRNPLSAEMIEGIRAKIRELQQRMAAHHIVAGSARALRLFS